MCVCDCPLYSLVTSIVFALHIFNGCSFMFSLSFFDSVFRRIFNALHFYFAGIGAVLLHDLCIFHRASCALSTLSCLIMWYWCLYFRFGFLKYIQHGVNYQNFIFHKHIFKISKQRNTFIIEVKTKWNFPTIFCGSNRCFDVVNSAIKFDFIERIIEKIYELGIASIHIELIQKCKVKQKIIFLKMLVCVLMRFFWPSFSWFSVFILYHIFSLSVYISKIYI